MYACADAEGTGTDAEAHAMTMQSAAAGQEQQETMFGDAQPPSMLDAPAALQGKKLRLGKRV